MRAPAQPRQHEPPDGVLLEAVVAVAAVERERLLGQPSASSSRPANAARPGLGDGHHPARVRPAGGVRDGARAVQVRVGARDVTGLERVADCGAGTPTRASRGRRAGPRRARPPRPRRRAGAARSGRQLTITARRSTASRASPRRAPPPALRRSAPRAAPVAARTPRAEPVTRARSAPAGSASRASVSSVDRLGVDGAVRIDLREAERGPRQRLRVALARAAAAAACA